VQLGQDMTSITVLGGGYCGEGRVLGVLEGDQGVYGSVHNGVLFIQTSLELSACRALCDAHQECVAFNWEAAADRANCVLRGTNSDASHDSGHNMPCYRKGGQ
jgi:hypothetical protein